MSNVESWIEIKVVGKPNFNFWAETFVWKEFLFLKWLWLPCNPTPQWLSGGILEHLTPFTVCFPNGKKVAVGKSYLRLLVHNHIMKYQKMVIWLFFLLELLCIWIHTILIFGNKWHGIWGQCLPIYGNKIALSQVLTF